VDVAGDREAEAREQVALPLTGVQQVTTAEDLCDAAEGVVDRAGELVGEEAVRAKDHEVATVGAKIDRYRTLEAVEELRGAFVHSQAPRMLLGGGATFCFVMREAPARPRVTGGSAAMGGRKGFGDFFSRAEAGVNETPRAQREEDRMIDVCSGRLADRFFIPIEAEGS
jgi:hypothetical protein